MHKRTRMDAAGSGLLVGGHLAVSAGVALLLPAAGLICLGLGAMGLGWLLCRSAGRMQS